MEEAQLSRKQTLRIAEMIAEDNLAEINKSCLEVNFKETFYSKYIKRLLDIIISLFALIITLPINIIIMIITFFDVGSPIFFTQERLGKDGEVFNIVKFRNMRNDVDEKGDLLPPSQRVTKWGKFVRKTSLDELLNFYSILKGDMSIIGPRPLVPVYYPRFNKRHKSRFLVKPGLELPPRNKDVGLRNWEEQFENDIWYVENISFITDIKMLINLIRFTFDKDNANQRSIGKRGSFMGYSKNGEIINQKNLPSYYIDRVLEEIVGDRID